MRSSAAGFTVKDRAWPFRSNVPSICGEAFKRSNACLGAWRKAEQINAGLFALVAVVVFIFKILAIISLLTNSSWVHSFGSRDAETPNEATTRRRLIEQQYRDDPVASRLENETPIENGENRPRVEPSRLIEQNNEWRDEGVAN